MARLNPSTVVAAAALLLLVGCGADGGTSVDAEGAQSTNTAPAATAAEPSGSPAAAASGDPAAAEFCSAVTSADTAAASAPDAYDGSPAPEQTDASRAAFTATYGPLLDRVKETAPESVAADVETYVHRARDAAGQDALLDSPEFARADSAVDAYLLQRCGYPEIPAYAVDYEFDRVPDTVPAGPTAISLTNDGEEIHQILVLRVAAGVEESIDDLLGLTGDELASKARAMAAVLAKPGTTNTSLANLEPGRYVAICYVPEGSKRGAKGDGEPHHTEGMATEFSVT